MARHLFATRTLNVGDRGVAMRGDVVPEVAERPGLGHLLELGWVEWRDMPDEWEAPPISVPADAGEPVGEASEVGDARLELPGDPSLGEGTSGEDVPPYVRRQAEDVPETRRAKRTR